MKPNILAASILAASVGNIQTFNDQTQLFDLFKPGSASAIQHGTILAANDANFDQQYIAEPLNDYIVGAPDDEGLQAAIEALFPSIPVGRAFTYRTHDTKEQYQTDSSDDGDIREIGGNFAKLRTTGAQVDGRTDNKGLTMVLDNDQGGEDTAVQQRAVVNLRNRLLRSDLRRGLVILDAHDSNDAKTWGSGTTAMPDLDVAVANNTGGDARGVDGNVVVWGKGAWIKRQLGTMANLSPGMAGLAQLSPASAAALGGCDRGAVLPFRYQSSATAKAAVLTDVVFIYHAKQGAMPDDPSNVKRFVTNTPSGVMRVYVQPELKKTLVTVEHYSRIVATSTVGIRKLTIS